jgi:polysaccharide deacetylase family protein (PEP-CTERM system associated)
MSNGVIKHHFTVDVEEYFQVSALEPYCPRNRWDSIPSRVEVGVQLLLDILEEHGATATFFVLGWIGERAPRLVREIHRRGHEIASHGSDHRRVTTLKQRAFRDSVRSSRQILQDLTGCAVAGYRAPSFSIVRGYEWALEVLLEEGYRYDSSLFPVRRPGYGFARGHRDPHSLSLSEGLLNEFPPATIEVGGMVLPAGGGAYLRLLPYQLVESGLRSAERRGVPATFYIHPWELDPDQPRFDVPLLTRIRHYGGLGRTLPRLRRLLSSFQFQSIAETLGLPGVLRARPIEALPQSPALASARR